MTESLHSAQSKLHFSVDLWSSRNLRALLGVNCHFADEFGNLKPFLLALPERSGPHSSVNIADNVAAIIHNFNLKDKIGYFMTDNATNNDTRLEELGVKFNFNPLHRRLRYSGLSLLRTLLSIACFVLEIILVGRNQMNTIRRLISLQYMLLQLFFTLD